MNKFKEEIKNAENLKYIFSNPLEKNDYKRVVVRKIDEANALWQQESYTQTQVFHANITAEELSERLEQLFLKYKQCCVQRREETLYAFNNNGECKIKKVAGKNKVQVSHNHKKKYFINEGDDVPVMVKLGVFTKDGKIVASKYDKFKQINRFVEIINDSLKTYNKEEISIIDFGCGKSYLTFVLYHYFTKIRGIKAHITGYDLKADVVENCNALAREFGYDGLSFYAKDVSAIKNAGENVDMLITLHACDVATDYALNYAINNGIKYIFSVPCCQHEVNLSILKGGDFDILLQHGIIRERFSALLTDAIRASVLKACSYKVDLVEFVDLAHTPKNIMIRATKATRKPVDPNQIRKMLMFCGATAMQTSSIEERILMEKMIENAETKNCFINGKIKAIKNGDEIEDILQLKRKYKFNQTLLRLQMENDFKGE